MKTYNYEVNRDGSIISKHTGKQIYVSVDRKGYCRVNLKHADGGKTYLVHRVVALTHIPNPDNLPQINHIDGDKSNNSVDNLEWTTGKKNVEHSVKTGLVPRGSERPNAKFSDNQVREMRKLREQGKTYYYLGDMFGCSYQTAHRIYNRLNYSHIT